MIEFEIDLEQAWFPKGRLESTPGYYTPAVNAPVAKITRHHASPKPIFQGLLTGKPVTENHILKQIPFEASFLNI